MNKINDIKQFIDIYGVDGALRYATTKKTELNRNWLKFNYQHFKKAYDNGKMLQAHNKWFKSRTGNSIDFNNLNTLSEKIQWIKLFENDPRKRKLSDKIESKKWASDIIGAEHVVEPICMWENIHDFNPKVLPEIYMLKLSHGCGFVYPIYWGKSRRFNLTFNINNLCDLLPHISSIDFAFVNAYEMQYHNIKPILYAEEDIFPESEYKLKFQYEYKIWCKNGKPLVICCCDPRYFRSRTFYTVDFKYQLMHDQLKKNKDFSICPKKIDTVLQFASILASEFNFARVDFMLSDNKIYFGEITFTPYSGIIDFLPEEICEEFAASIKIKKLKNNVEN